MKIAGATAFVTGANGGSGSAIVRELLARDVGRVYAACRRRSTMRELFDDARVTAVELDVTDDASVAKAVQAAAGTTLLVNNAGMTVDQGFLSADDLVGAQREMAVNYFGPIRLIRAFAPTLKAAPESALLNVLSLLSNIVLPMAGSYSASKFAALAMTRGVRAELRAQNTLVVGAMPAAVDTPLAKNYPDPKVSPEQVAREALDAVEAGVEDVYPGDVAKTMIEAARRDAKAVEEQMAANLPAPRAAPSP